MSESTKRRKRRASVDRARHEANVWRVAAQKRGVTWPQAYAEWSEHVRRPATPVGPAPEETSNG